MLDLLIKKHPSLLFPEEISDICKPLHKLNINYFSHVRITHDKKFSAISSNPYFTEHYLKNQYFTTDIHTLNQTSVGNYFVWDHTEFTNRTAQLCQEAGEFGIHNPITLMIKNKFGVDYYHFASHMVDKKINTFYVANLDLLHLFIDHFKANINQSRMLSKAYDFVIDAQMLLGQDPAAAAQHEVIANRNDFMNSINIITEPERLRIADALLSKRQTEVLRYVARGKTFKEISRLTGLSPRTVGHYFETVKNKLRASTRSQVIEIVKEIKADKYT